VKPVVVKVLMGLVVFEKLDSSVNFRSTNSSIFVNHPTLYRLLHKLNNYGLSSGYINWIHSYLTSRESCGSSSGLFSFPFVVLSGVPQKSILWSLLFNIFINDLPEVIDHYSCLLFADDLKVYRAIKSPNECSLLQLDIERVQEWSSANL
jgi:hypothetical protein